MATVNDNALVGRARRGDKDAFATLARKYEGQVYAIAYSRLVNVADAEDVVQETFLQAYRALHQLRTPDRFGGWVARIALSFSAKRLHGRRREPVVDVGELLKDTATAVVEQERYERDEDARGLIEGALASLPEALRTPFVMRHAVDASYKSIAEALIISPRAAERRVRRARAMLQRYFASRGMVDVARDALLTSLVIPRSMRDPVDGLPDGPPPTPQANPGGGALAVGFAGAVALSGAIVLLGGLKAMGSSARVGARDVVMVAGPVSSWPGAAPTRGVGLARADRSSIPAGARLIADMDFEGLAPGQPLPGWSRGVYAQTSDTRPGGRGVGAVVTTNIPSAYFRFPRVQGVLTIDVWVKPHPGDNANFGIRIGHDGREWGATDTPIVDTSVLLNAEPKSFMPFLKDDTDRLFYRFADMTMPVPFAAYDGEWHHVRVRYDTDRAEYSLYVDGDLAEGPIPAPAQFPDGVSFVALNSGRWGYEEDEASYFDDMTIYVEPMTEGPT